MKQWVNRTKDNCDLEELRGFYIHHFNSGWWLTQGKGFSEEFKDAHIYNSIHDSCYNMYRDQDTLPYIIPKDEVESFMEFLAEKEEGEKEEDEEEEKTKEETKMSTKDKIKIMQAFEDGEAVEIKMFDEDTGWRGLRKESEPSWMWNRVDYRIKPEPEILGCPFCGEQPAIDISDDQYSIHCFSDHCDCEVNSCSYQKDEAIKSWNRRTQ